MDKLVILPGKTDQGIFTYVIDAEKNYLEKTAAAYHPTIASYINAAKPIQGKTQILLTALGAGEWWANNVNGDYFPEQALAHEGTDYGYKTFEYYAKLYKHHLNKPHEGHQIYGTVGLSVYNPMFHRVELIVLIDNHTDFNLIDSIEQGDYPDFSMGCKVPYDVCRLCGNRAPTRKQYCDHLKYYMARIPPGFNKIAYAINDFPKFFDISIVLIGADRIAKMHTKVAGKRAYFFIGGALLAEKMAEAKAAAERKVADIDKNVPAEPPASIDKVKDLAGAITEVKAHEPPLPTDLLNRLGRLPISSVMSTLAMLGILPKPQEFQRIVLVSFRNQPAADLLDQHGQCFDPMDGQESPAAESILGMDHRKFSPDIMQLLQPYLPQRSYAAPLLGPRLAVMLTKQGAEAPLPTFLKLSNDTGDERKPVGILPMLALAAGMYAVFARKAPPEAVTGIDKLVATHPGLAAALGLGLYRTFSDLAKPGIKGNFVPGETYTNPDAVDVFKRIEEQKSKPYEKVASLGAAAKRLFIGIPAAYMASGVLQKHRELNPNDGEGRTKAFVRRNPDVVSGALIADAMLALHGKSPTQAVARGAKSLFTKSAEAASELTGDPSIKTASAQEFLTHAMLGGLPGRIVGGLFDQAALETSRDLLDKFRVH